MVYDAVPEDHGQFIEVPGTGHSVVLWMRDNKAEAEQLLNKIDAFLQS